MDAYRIPLCVPAYPPHAFAVDHHSILQNCQFSSRSCLWIDVYFATPYTLRNAFGYYECEMREGQPKLDVEAEVVRNTEDLPTREPLVLRVWQDSGIWVVN